MLVDASKRSQCVEGEEMNQRIELAKSGRSKCRACKEKIEKSAWRFGHDVKSDYGFTTQWLHLKCASEQEKVAAFFLEALNASKEAIPERDVLRKSAEALASASPKSRKSKPAAPIPPLEGIEPEVMSKLADKLKRMSDSTSIYDVYRRSGVDEYLHQQKKALMFHLLSAGAVKPEQNVHMLEAFCELADGTHSIAETFTKVPNKTRRMNKFGRGIKGWFYLPEWSEKMHECGIAALVNDRDAMIQALPDMKPTIRAGLNFIRALSGEYLEDAALAELQAAFGTFVKNEDQDNDGKWHNRPDNIWGGRNYDSPAIKLLERLVGVKWNHGKREVTITRTVGRGQKLSHWLERHAHFRTQMALYPSALIRKLRDRNDSPEELIKTAARVAKGAMGRAEEEGHGAWAAEFFVLVAIERAIEEGRDDLEELYGHFKHLRARHIYQEELRTSYGAGYERVWPLYKKVYSNAPNEFAKREVENALKNTEDDPAFFFLLSLDGDELIDTFADQPNYNYHVVRELDGRALSVITRKLENGVGNQARHAKFTFNLLSRYKGTLTDTTAWHLCAPHLPAVLNHKSGWALGSFLLRVNKSERFEVAKAIARSSSAYGAVLSAMKRLELEDSDERTLGRLALEASAEDPTGLGQGHGKDFAHLWAELHGEVTLNDAQRKVIKSALRDDYGIFAKAADKAHRSWLDELRDLASGVTEPKRIYLLEVDSTLKDAPSPRTEKSWSVVGGAGPEKAQWPQGSDPTHYTHVLTIDVADAPELSHRYPDAVAVSVFAPDDTIEDGFSDTKVLPVPKGAKRPVGDALHLLPLDAPDLSAGEHPMRKALLRRGRYLFGSPMWIQGEEPLPSPFLMQLDEALGVNAGDSGFVYIYEDGASMQCY